MALPSLPKVPSLSLRKTEPSTAPIRTESAPRGVTRMAGAKAYAAKLHISPITTLCTDISHYLGSRELLSCGVSYVLRCRPTILGFAGRQSPRLRIHVFPRHPLIPAASSYQQMSRHEMADSQPGLWGLNSVYLLGNDEARAWRRAELERTVKKKKRKGY